MPLYSIACLVCATGISDFFSGIFRQDTTSICPECLAKSTVPALSHSQSNTSLKEAVILLQG